MNKIQFPNRSSISNYTSIYRQLYSAQIAISYEPRVKSCHYTNFDRSNSSRQKTIEQEKHMHAPLAPLQDISNLYKQAIKRPNSEINQSKFDFLSFKCKSSKYLHYLARLKYPPPKISAKAWAIFEVTSCKLVFGHKSQNQREVASLTKIMTILTVFKLCKLMNIQYQQTYLKVSKTSANVSGFFIPGTSANLRMNTWLNIMDLFYGLLLPSGNDCAYMLAENIGALFQLFIEGNPKLFQLINDKTKKVELNNLIISVNSPIAYFVNEMNKYAKELDITNSNWCNPHGLANKFNRSSAYDIGRLSCKAMQNELFRKIVKCKEYKAILFEEDGVEGEICWQNTNRMLDEGWEGIKTGITIPAGPCLSACKTVYFTDMKKSYSFVIVLLTSQSMEHRWMESRQILNWIIGKE